MRRTNNLSPLFVLITVTLLLCYLAPSFPVAKADIVIQDPSAGFAYTPSNPHAKSTVSFDASASHGGSDDGYDTTNITMYYWQYGDGANDTYSVAGGNLSKFAAHVFAVNGTYNVNLTITTDIGPSPDPSYNQTNFVTQTVTVLPAIITVMAVTPQYTLVITQNKFTVSIVVINGSPFVGFQATLNFFSSDLVALSGNITLPWPGCQLIINNNTGLVTIYGFNPTSPIEGNQTLATVNFQALKQANSTLSLTGTYLTGPFPSYNTTLEPNESAIVEAVDPTNLTVASVMGHYYVSRNMIIAGNATLDGSHVSALLGLEMNNPKNSPIVRTLITGAGPSQDSWPINITEFYPSDQYGNYSDSFLNGTQAYFTIQIQNTVDYALPFIICVNVMDTHNSLIGETVAQGIVQPSSQDMLISAVYLPYTVYIGNATAYAEVFSDWPHNGGVPYCPEQLTTLSITGGLATGPRIVPYGNITFQSDFAIVFNLTSAYSLGNYSIYVTTQYKTITYMAHATLFDTVLCDFNGDGIVTGRDLNRLLVAFGSTPAKSKWFPEADFNQDGIITGYDLNTLLVNFGKHI